MESLLLRALFVAREGLRIAPTPSLRKIFRAELIAQSLVLAFLLWAAIRWD
jgi:hypothetical protein